MAISPHELISAAAPQKEVKGRGLYAATLAGKGIVLISG